MGDGSDTCSDVTYLYVSLGPPGRVNPTRAKVLNSTCKGTHVISTLQPTLTVLLLAAAHSLAHTSMHFHESGRSPCLETCLSVWWKYISYKLVG